MSDESWVPVANTDTVVEGEPSSAYAHGEEIALFKIGDEVFATSNICTHGFARLSDGYLDGYLIECPLHQGLFDVRTGRCAGDPVDVDLASFDVRIREGIIELRRRAG